MKEVSALYEIFYDFVLEGLSVIYLIDSKSLELSMPTSAIIYFLSPEPLVQVLVAHAASICMNRDLHDIANEHSVDLSLRENENAVTVVLESENLTFKFSRNAHKLIPYLLQKRKK